VSAQHTPGPWTVSDLLDDGRLGIVSNNCDAFIVVGANRNLKLDDARLIAAAPELLAALQPFVRHNSSEPTITITVRTTDVSRARAAIAIATWAAR